MMTQTLRSQSGRTGAVRLIVVVILTVGWHLAGLTAEQEPTLQDAISARTEVTVLRQEVGDLDAEILVPMRKVIAKAEAQEMAANILLTKDKYGETVKAYNQAAAYYRQALDGRKVLEKLAQARRKADRARLLAEGSAKPDQLREAKRLEINADGYVEAAEFDQAIAELDKARKAYEALLAPGAPATLEQVVAARTAMLSARAQIKGLPPFEAGAEPSILRKRPLPILPRKTADVAVKRPKPESLPGVLERAISAELAAAEALEEREYPPARALFAAAEKLYRATAALQSKRDQVVEAQKTAEESEKLADAAFQTPARPVAFELGKQALADGAKALADEDLDKAKELFSQAVEQFAKAHDGAQAANVLAKAQSEWAAAQAQADETLLAKHVAGAWDAARKLAAAAETRAAAGDTSAATAGFLSATTALKEATANAQTAENAAKAVPVIQRLEAAVARGDKFAAQVVLAELEKLIPSDSRLASFRARVAALPLPKSFTLDLGSGVKMEFVLIRPGSFLMGSAKSSDTDEKPVHKVTIAKPFYLGKYEVTQEQWQAVMGNNPSIFKGPKNPVERVSWNDCQEFMKKINEKSPGMGFRLPTEAQWEYVCRAGSATEYCYGDSESALGEYAWYGGNSSNTTHPVGEKKPNAWGLYDMHGNVWEWCQDGYHDSYNGAPTDGSAWESGAGSARVLRGGSWDSKATDVRSAYRYTGDPTSRGDASGGFGFRVCCPASP